MGKSDKQRVVCIIPAAGSGERVVGDVPKQYMKINGIPILRCSVLAFLRHADVDEVLVVYNPKDKHLYDQAVGDLDILPPVIGGDTRQESVRMGLESLKNNAPHTVLIHDAARPLVSNRVISRVLNAVNKNRSVIPTVPVEDTLKKCIDGMILHTINRNDLMRAQTPQGFIYKEILSAHRQVQEVEFTDDASIEEFLGNGVTVVNGSQLNFKITTNEDIERAETVMQGNFETRIGTGFDVHKFCDAKSQTDNAIMLCGVAVPHDRSLKGHSDADVGIHALVDALLGAISEGDIGEHFPPSDDSYKDMDSRVFLEHAADLIAKKNASVINVDITIICEKPKLSKYKKGMVAKIAEILNISSDRVSVKATTTEKLGFTGRQEGIAVQAAASVKVLEI